MTLRVLCRQHHLVLWLLLLLSDTLGQLALKHGSVTLAARQTQASPAAAAADSQLIGFSAAATSPWVWLGVACYLASFVTWLRVLHHTPLSRAYAISSFSYITVLGASWLLLHEPITLLQSLGVLFIMAGVILISSEATS